MTKTDENLLLQTIYQASLKYMLLINESRSFSTRIHLRPWGVSHVFYNLILFYRVITEL